MDLYSEIILDHYKHPHNKGKLKNATISVDEINTSCGDSIKLHLLVGKDKKIKKAMFEGAGCAISQAAASMLTDKLVGMSLKNIEKISNEDIYKMLGVQISAGRVKCALLGISTARKATLKLKIK